MSLNQNYSKKATVYSRQTGYIAMPSGANGVVSLMELKEVISPVEGYIFVYLTNESNKEVYFDDFKVKLKESNVIQSNNYYPFGLQHSSSWTRISSVKNNFLYNAGTELNERTKNYETYFREYDPALGRFNQIDPLAASFTSHTPYNYAFNNPIALNDPKGDAPGCANCSYVEEYHTGYGDFVRGSYEFSLHNDGSGNGIGPGSGNHWSDEFRDQYGDYFLMSNARFEAKYGLSMGDYRESLILDRAAQSGELQEAWLAGWTGQHGDQDFNEVYLIIGGIGIGVREGQNNQNGGSEPFLWTNRALTTGGALYKGLDQLMANHRGWLDSKGNFQKIELLQKGENGKYVRGVQGYRNGLNSAIQAGNKFRIAGSATAGVSIITGGVSTYYGYKQDGNQFGYNAQSAAGSSVGGMLGAWAGAKSGAIAGGAIGVWFGGAGAVPGAAIGAFVGGLLGGFGGSYLGESSVNYIHGK